MNPVSHGHLCDPPCVPADPLSRLVILQCCCPVLQRCWKAAGQLLLSQPDWSHLQEHQIQKVLVEAGNGLKLLLQLAVVQAAASGPRY